MVATSRLLTSHRRDIIAQLVNDDPANAELLFELLVVTDPSTAAGAAAREDALNYSYSLTPHSKKGQRQLITEIIKSTTALVA